MSHCRDEHHEHDDHHEHHGHNHEHDHDGPDRGAEYTLYKQIDIDNVTCLNESEDGSAKTVFKSWEERWDVTKVRVLFAMSPPPSIGFVISCGMV